MTTWRSMTTIAMLVGTVATAAGLNLSVLALDDGPDATTSTGGGAADALGAPPDPATIAGGSPRPVASLVGDPVEPEPAVVVVAADTTVAGQPTPTAPAASDPTSATGSSVAGTAPVTATITPSPTAPSTKDVPAVAAPTASAAAPPSTRRPTTATTSRSTTTAEPVERITDQFRGVATIEVAVHGGDRLELLSVEPVGGMAYRVDGETPTSIEIVFRPTGGGEEAEWHIRLEDGQPRIDKER
jgi:hypothetical protein